MVTPYSTMYRLQVASRAVFMTAAFITILGGVIGKFGAVFVLIPDPVIGGLGLVTLGMVIAMGVSMFRSVNLASSRNLMIIGFSLGQGLLLPSWVDNNRDSINTGTHDTTSRGDIFVIFGSKQNVLVVSGDCVQFAVP